MVQFNNTQTLKCGDSKMKMLEYLNLSLSAAFCDNICNQGILSSLTLNYDDQKPSAIADILSSAGPDTA